MSHTPGPYIVKTRTNGVCATIETRDGKELAMLDCGTITFLDNVSNASLFAAAPDMLEILIELQARGLRDVDAATRARVQMAIDKARGES